MGHSAAPRLVHYRSGRACSVVHDASPGQPIGRLFVRSGPRGGESKIKWNLSCKPCRHLLWRTRCQARDERPAKAPFPSPCALGNSNTSANASETPPVPARHRGLVRHHSLLEHEHGMITAFVMGHIAALRLDTSGCKIFQRLPIFSAPESHAAVSSVQTCSTHKCSSRTCG